MKQDLKFFTDRVGFKVHRSSDVMVTGVITITDEKYAKELYASQDDGCVFSVSAKLRIIMQHIQLMFDGRSLKVKDIMEALRKIETLQLMLENPNEMPETYRDMYVQIIEKRKASYR